MNIVGTLVQADTGPDITSTLTYDDGTVVDLTGSSVRFQMRLSTDRRFTVNAAATIVTAALGKVSYSWTDNDLSVPGTYQSQWQVTFPDGKVITTDPPEELIVRRQ